MAQQESLFWKKKEFVSFILSIFVFFIHISSWAQYEQGNGLMTLINEKAAVFLRDSFVRVAVPMFFILSGIAFFKNYDDSKYLSKMKSRVFTLVIPYL